MKIFMKKSKKIFLGIIAFFIVAFVAFTVYMRTAVKCGYTLDGCFVVELGDEKNSFVSKLVDSYGVSRKKAEEIYNNQNEWVNVTISYDIENNSCLPIFVINTFSVNKNGIYVCRDVSEKPTTGIIYAGETGCFTTDIIVNKSDFSEKTLSSLKLKIISLPVTFKAKFWGFPSLENLSFDIIEVAGGFENGVISYVDVDWNDGRWDDEAEKAEEVSWLTEDFLMEYAYYLPDSNIGELKANNYSIAICRFFPNGFYNAHKFKCNGKEYIGFSFFDDNMDFMGGMALNALRGDKDMFENLEIGKAVFEDVKALDSACIVFKDGENFKSCHYFADKTCIEFTYSADGVITSKSEPDVEKLFDLLINSDIEHIENL